MRISKNAFFILTLAGLTSTACKKDANTPKKYKEVLTEITENVILSNYADIVQKTNILQNQLQNLRDNPTETHLNTARQAWRDARAPWEGSEGWLFGPVESESLDPSLDTWPLNTVDLDSILNGSQTIDAAYVATLDGSLKGYHTIEYLIWGIDGNKNAGDITARQFDYILACAADIVRIAENLYDVWAPEGDNFADNLINAGEDNSLYINQKAALSELVAGIISIADEVGNGKIEDPFVNSDLSFEESRFSNNSKADFTNNIKSIEYIYFGRYTNDGMGLNDIVRVENPDLDTKIQTQINDAIAAIAAIPVSFSDAVFNNRPTIQTAQDKILLLLVTLQDELRPLITNL